MTTFKTILSGAAGLAFIASASPAAAQYAPNGGYNNGGVVGAVINSVLGGGRYGAYGQGPNSNAVDQCARAAEARVSAQGGYGNRGYGYNQNGYNQNGYRQMGVARVVGITGVERRSNGLKVSGIMNSGYNANGGYGNQGYNYQGYPNQGYPNQGYGNPNYAYSAQNADLRFSCKVDFRGYVSNVRIDRMNYRRG
jgi:hypothetical protein